MKHILLFFLIISTSSFSQVFHLENGKLKLYQSEKGETLLSEQTFDRCWCDQVKNDSGEITFYKPKNEAIDRILGKQSTGWGVLNKKGELLSEFNSEEPFTFSSPDNKILLSGFKDTLFTIQGVEGSYLVEVDTSGKELKKLHVRDDHKGHFLASENGNDWGISTVNMRTLLRMKYDPARYNYDNFRFNEKGLIPLESKGSDNKYGIVNYKGQIQVGFRYDFMIDYIEDENHIYAEVLGKKGYIDKHGHTVFPIIHEKLPFYLTDSNLVATEKYVWIMDENLKQIGDYRWQILKKEGDVYFFKKHNRWGVMDLQLNTIIENDYTAIDDGPRIRDKNDFKTYVVVKNRKIGVIDLEGNVIIPCNYNCRCTLGYFSPSGYFIELANGDTAYRFNEKGEIVEKVSAKGKTCLCESYD